VVNLVLRLGNVIFLLRLLSLLAVVSMPLQPELNVKVRLQVSSMYLNLRKSQRRQRNTGSNEHDDELDVRGAT